MRRADDSDRLQALAEDGEDVVAARAGLSQVWVSRIEAGGGHGTPATRRKLAKALAAPLWALEDGD